MRKLLAALVIFATGAFAANLKLYLNDGTYQLAREYSVKGDRVRFYSVERSDWEEIPVALVDLKRTETETAERKTKLEQEAKVLSAEDKAERDLENEVMRIPQTPGTYYLTGNETKRIAPAESKVHTNKGRSILKVMAPIPIVSGKATVEIDKERSQNVLTNPQPELYIQLETLERFGIVKLRPEKGVRVVEKVTTVPVTKEIVEEPEEVEIFRKQLTQNGLYKIWPTNPLEPGEYAVVEFTPGKLNMQIWDFAYRPAAK